MADLTPEQLAEGLNPGGHFRNIKREILGESAGILRRNLVRLTPHGKSGKMRDAVRVEVDEGSEEVSLGYDESVAPYAKFVLAGTRPHLIRPRTVFDPRGRGSQFRDRPTGRFRTQGAKMLRFEVGGRVVFAREVKHPGTKEQATKIYGGALNASQGAIDGMLSTYGEELMVRIATAAPVGVGRIRIR